MSRNRTRELNQKEVWEYAGNLEEEIREINKISAGEQQVMEIETQTRKCLVFFTLYCC